MGLDAHCCENYSRKSVTSVVEGWMYSLSLRCYFSCGFNIYTTQQLQLFAFLLVVRYNQEVHDLPSTLNADILKGVSTLKGKFCVAPSVMRTLALTHFMEHNDVHSNPLTYVTHKCILPANVSCLRHFYMSVIWSVTIFHL